ncbi:MAG TPA: T9SS type A sorting domain-containing protein, partial [Candidatus Marinimicrobia bacterium]|nr:T9SS type A sorting domain-containing protein [Candidatus Neomarinimicrobiota bacterium]
QMIRLREGTGGDFRNVIVAYGNGVGVRVSDAATQVLIGDSLLFNENNIIYDCANGQFHTDNPGMTAVDVDPMFMELNGREDGAGIIDPRPAAGSPAYIHYVSLPDDGFFVQTDYAGAFDETMWLDGWSLLSEKGRLSTASSIESDLNTLAAVFALNVYPNPFNPTANIRISMPKNDEIRIHIYNILGQVVSELYSGYMNKGSHTLSIDGSNLISGIYFVKVLTGEMNYTHRITLLK